MKQKLFNALHFFKLRKNQFRKITFRETVELKKTISYFTFSLTMFFLTTISFSANAQAILSVNAPSTICSGSIASIKVIISGGTAPYKVTYTVAGTPTTKTNYLSGTPINVTPAFTTSYALTSVIDATNKTLTASGSVTITVNPKPVMPFITTSGSTVLCSGESVTLTSSEAPTGATYKWTPGNATTKSIVVSSSGNYSVQIIANGCTSNSSSAKLVTINPQTSTPIIGTIIQPTCSVNTGSIILSNLPDTGAWTINPGTITGTGTTATLDKLTPGVYHFTVTNQNGCISGTSADATLIAPVNTLATPVLYNALVSCNQSSYLLDWTAIENATNYALDIATDENFSSFLAGYQNKELGNVNFENITSIIPGIPYYIRLRAVNGCGTSPNSNTITIQTPAISTPVIGLITSPACLENTGSIVLENLPSTGIWTINPGAITGTGTTTTLSNINPGNYQFFVISENGCVSDLSAIATVNEKTLIPIAPILNSQINSCQSSFNQTWEAAINATGYQLDVSSDVDFVTFLPDYQAKELGNVTSQTVTGIIPGNNYYVRLRAVNNCGVSPNSNSIIVSPVTTTYDNGTWSNGLPNSTKTIVFNSNYNISTDMNACSCKVNAGAIITVQSGVVLKLENALNVDETASVTFENNSSLVQVNEAVNIGKIVYQRYSSPMENFDWTSWSSPVAGYTLHQVSPNTILDKYQYYSPTSGWQTSINGVAVMQPGVGYNVRTPKDGVWPDGEIVAFPYSQLVNFTGVPNNGTIIGANHSPNQWHYIGNPYPSALDVETFLEENWGFYGTISIKNHNTPITNLKYSPNDDSMYNFLGGIAGAEPGQGVTSTKPTGKIAAGQSFFAYSWNTGTITFNNGMRVLGENSQFYKPGRVKKVAAIEKHRLWLNLTNTSGGFRQILIGYATDATNDYDSRYDDDISRVTTHIRFYSINLGVIFDIQGRALPFDNTDIVPLGYNATIAGTHTIEIDEVDGLFVDQAIYLEDKTTSTYHNLKDGAYFFSTLAGTFDDRFVIHYINTTNTDKKLTTSNIDQNITNNHLMYVNNNGININSFNEKIEKVNIYDIKGSLIYQKNTINNNSMLIDKLGIKNQVLIVKVTFQSGKITTTKIVL